MAKTYNVMKIDIKEEITDIITAKQDDLNSHYLDVYLRDNGIPINLTGHEVKIYGEKADGTVFFNDGEVTDPTNGRCQFPITSQALAIANDLNVEISIWKDNVQILTTQTFTIGVVKSLRSNNSIESSNEFGALVILYQKLYDFIADVTELLHLVGQPADTDGTTLEGTVMAKMNKMLEYTQSIAQQADSIQYRASNTLQSTNVYEFIVAESKKYRKIKQFYAKYNGYIHVYITASNAKNGVEVYIFRSLHDYFNIENGTGYNKKHMMIPALFLAPEDSILNNFEVKIHSIKYDSSTSHRYANFMNQIYGVNYELLSGAVGTTTNTGYVVMDVVFPVKKGEQVVFVAYPNIKADVSITLKMYYDEVAI